MMGVYPVGRMSLVRLYPAATLTTPVMTACYLSHTLTQRMTQITQKIMIDKRYTVAIH
jgi:hypothetical protein